MLMGRMGFKLATVSFLAYFYRFLGPFALGWYFYCWLSY
jgi:hypothetical protein